MNSAERLFALLACFTEQAPVWETDALIAALGCTRATGYRAIKTLVDAGFLVKLAAGRYALGPRIVQLDWQLRSTDPVLRRAVPVMESLVEKTGFDAVLSVLMGETLIDTHRASRQGSRLELGYGRGRPRPLFLGASPRVLLAHLPVTTQRRLQARHAVEVARCGMGQNWQEFRARLAAVREAGWSLSLGELEAHLGAIAVPVFGEEGTVVAALALVGSPQAIERDQVKALDAVRQARNLMSPEPA
ncbi:MAG: IclR family transcriptional regulator [Burkholderiales bacterium]|jgi:DNA-binding IclR family transcriptional regulator